MQDREVREQGKQNSLNNDIKLLNYRVFLVFNFLLLMFEIILFYFI